MVPKMILCLGFVDLVDHVAISILVRHVAYLGIRRIFWKSSSCVFIHTAFSMQAAGSVLWRTTACDRVW